MNNASFPATSQTQQSWPPTEAVKQESGQKASFFEWWYKLTAVPEPPASASFVKREAARQVRLLSTILFFWLPTLILASFSTFFIPNPAVRYIVLGLIIVCSVSLFINRSGRVTAASYVLVAGLEGTLTSILLTTHPLDETALQFYDLYILGILFAAPLLPIRSVFVLALCNSLFFWLDITYQPHTPELAKLVEQQFLAIIVRPIALQIIVAGVSYLWVSSATRAIMRADRAEMVAKLEHTLVEQKRELEAGIQQILQTHVAVANGNLNARAPLTQDNMLWKIARALNTLLVRLQRASLAEKELQRVEQAVTDSVSAIQQAEWQQQLPRLPFTHTALDPLIAALQGKTLAYTQSPFLHQSRSGQSEDALPPSSQKRQL